MARPRPDLYELLGVPPSADEDAVRQAFRRLALQHHPDRAGDQATAYFQLLTEAYRVLSDPEARDAYDTELRARNLAPPATARSGPVAGRSVEDVFGLGRGRPAGRPPDVIVRLTGALEDLLARALARRCADGAVEFALTNGEADRGGTLLFDVVAAVTCPTCDGAAAPRDLWCARCEYAGTVDDVVTVAVAVPPLVADRTEFKVAVDARGGVPPLRVRVRR